MTEHLGLSEIRVPKNLWFVKQCSGKLHYVVSPCWDKPKRKEMEAFETSGNTCWFHMSIDPEVQKTIVHQIHFLDRIRRSFQTTNWWSPIKWIASPSPTLFRSLRKWNYGFVWKWVCPNLWQPYAWQNLWWTLINHGIPFVPPQKPLGFPPPLCLSQIPERPHAVMLPHACGRCNLSWQTRRIRRAGESQRSHPPPRRSVAPRLQKCPRWGSPRESLYLRKFPMGIPRWFHGKTPFFFMIYDDLGGTPHDLGVSSISAMFITWSWSVSHWWVSVYWCLSYPSLHDVNWCQLGIISGSGMFLETSWKHFHF